MEVHEPADDVCSSSNSSGLWILQHRLVQVSPSIPGRVRMAELAWQMAESSPAALPGSIARGRGHGTQVSFDAHVGCN